MSDQQLGTVVIGGSQAGLAVGYYLKQHGLPFVILDENDRIGDAWRKRWDSLRLFTPGRYDGLPGMPFPGSPSSYPTKDETADYLEAYASTFELPVRTGVKVDRLSKAGDRFEVSWGEHTLFAENVVVATGAFNTPRVPSFARELDREHRPTPLQGVPQTIPNSERNSARGGRRKLRGGDRDGARSPSQDMAIRPGHGAGTRPRRKSSRSPDHAPHVVRGDAVDGKDGAWTEAPRPLHRPASWNPSGAGATKGFCPRRHRTSAANDRREEWISGPREWKGPRGVERHLVHRIRTPLRLDRSLAANPQWPSHSRSGHRRVLSRSLLRRAPLPLLAELGAVGRCGTRRQAHRRPHRYHPIRKRNSWPERAAMTAAAD